MKGVSNQGMANMLAQGGKGGDNDSERDELNSRQWATIGEDMWCVVARASCTAF